MLFFCYHRDRAGALDLRMAMVEQHWSYMDRFADRMVARGPTLTDDGEVPTGSIHVVDLPDPAAGRAFAFEEPCYQAGAYRDVMLRRWDDLLGRTMWECPGLREEARRWFVLGLGAGERPAYELPAPSDEMLAFGALLSDDGASWLGTVALLQAEAADAARAVLDPVPHAAVEVHRWERGGRPRGPDPVG